MARKSQTAPSSEPTDSNPLVVECESRILTMQAEWQARGEVLPYLTAKMKVEKQMRQEAKALRQQAAEKPDTTGDGSPE
jgi:hypothetical protein